MSPLNTALPEERTRAKTRRPPPKSLSGSPGKCLLVSTDEACLEGMRHAASGAGWDCLPCECPKDSLRQAFLERYALAIVDIVPAEHRRQLTDLLRILANSSQGLVIAYDRWGEPASELWARENGVWLYLPGVADWEELTSACQEARRIREQIENRDAMGTRV